MDAMLSAASPLEIAALWRLKFLSGDDVAAICMQWLERDLDRGDPDIAALAGERGLVVEAVAPTFERILKSLNGRTLGRDEALLRALRLHLAYTLGSDDLRGNVQKIIDRFAHLAERRLVHHPRRAQDRPDGVYAEQNLGLEYVYGGFYAFDDIWHFDATKRLDAEHQLTIALRQDVQELHDFLSATVAG